MSTSAKKVIFLSSLGALILFGIFQNTRKKNELKAFGRQTTALVTEFNHLRRTSYQLKFKYTVGGKTYYNSVRTSSFKCDNGVSGCVGSIFKVVYSEKKPDVSRIDLGEYDKFVKFKPTF